MQVNVSVSVKNRSGSAKKIRWGLWPDSLMKVNGFTTHRYCGFKTMSEETVDNILGNHLSRDQRKIFSVKRLLTFFVFKWIHHSVEILSA